MNLDNRFDKIVFPDVWIAVPKINFSTHKYHVQLERFTYTHAQPFVTARHDHPTYEFHYCPTGGGDVTIGERTYAITPGKFFITGPYVHHSQVSYNENPNEEYGFMLNIEQLKSKKQSDNVLIYDDLDNIFDIIVKNKAYFGTDSNEAWKSLEKIYTEFVTSNDTINISQIWVLLFQTLISTASNIRQLPRIVTRDFCNNLDLKRIAHLDDIFRGYFVDISQEDVANDLGISVRQLNRITTKNYGLTFKQKYLESRMDLAISLLENADNLSIDEIAQKLNFNSQPYFSKIFKSFYGVSPLQYRKKKK